MQLLLICKKMANFWCLCFTTFFSNFVYSNASVFHLLRDSNRYCGTLSNFFVAITFFIVFTMISTIVLKQKSAIDICNELHEIHQLLKIWDKNYLHKGIFMILKLLILVNVFSVQFSPSVIFNL